MCLCQHSIVLECTNHLLLCMNVLSINKRERQERKKKNRPTIQPTDQQTNRQGLGIYKRKHALVQENNHSFKKTRSRPRMRPKKRSRKKENFLFFLDAFLVERVFSWASSFLLEQVIFLMNECVFSCFLTFFFFFYKFPAQTLKPTRSFLGGMSGLRAVFHDISRNSAQNNSLFDAKKVLLIYKNDLVCKYFFFNDFNYSKKKLAILKPCRGIKKNFLVSE